MRASRAVGKAGRTSPTKALTTSYAAMPAAESRLLKETFRMARDRSGACRMLIACLSAYISEPRRSSGEYSIFGVIRYVSEVLGHRPRLFGTVERLESSGQNHVRHGAYLKCN